MAFNSSYSLDSIHAVSSVESEKIVSRNPEVMNGELVFSGTRVPVQILIDHIAAGDSIDDFLADFPSVSREQAVEYLEMTLRMVELE